jgi:hypothetical protein
MLDTLKTSQSDSLVSSPICAINLRGSKGQSEEQEGEEIFRAEGESTVDSST